MENTGVIILAAGKGSRMNATTVNKVAMPLGTKPIIRHVVDVLHHMNMGVIIVVVGFAKESVVSSLRGADVLFADQGEQLGTAHAVLTAIQYVPETIENVLVIQGDDSAFYTKDLIQTFLEAHAYSKAAVTLLTIELENPTGLGRIVRDTTGNVDAIIEEKDATDAQRKIKEINPACYIFNVDFLKEYLPQVQASPVTKEYYVTSLIHMAIEHGKTLETVRGGRMAWRGVNTPEELQEAEELFKKVRT